MLEIYRLGEEILREKGEPVKTFDNALAILVDAMFETMGDADGVGLAAPQIGLAQRFFVVDTKQPGERLVFINPQIMETSVEQVSYEEGCLSIPGAFAHIVRPAEVTVQALDLKGKPFTLKATNLLARVIQHENDHLNGVLFIDHMEEEAREKLLEFYHRQNKKKHS